MGSAHADSTPNQKSAPAIATVRVKGGCFRMGDIFQAGGPDERPEHEVCLRDFSIGKYPVTQLQWEQVAGNNPSKYRGDDLPVENVSFYEVQTFIKALREKTGKKWRLPTEAEWEYAARSGGKPQKYPGTSKVDELSDYAWTEGNSDAKIHPVGTKRPNDFGIYDMAGNVWQWVSDRYGRDYYRQSPKDNPKGDPFGVNRVLRGGSAAKEPFFVRVSNRDYQAPEHRETYVGFRLALSDD